MTVKLTDDRIASNQTSAFPRVSSLGNKYICVFYIHDPDFIKGIAIKSGHISDFLSTYQPVYKW